MDPQLANIFSFLYKGMNAWQIDLRRLGGCLFTKRNMKKKMVTP